MLEKITAQKQNLRMFHKILIFSKLFTFNERTSEIYTADKSITVAAQWVENCRWKPFTSDCVEKLSANSKKCTGVVLYKYLAFSMILCSRQHFPDCQELLFAGLEHQDP